MLFTNESPLKTNPLILFYLLLSEMRETVRLFINKIVIMIQVPFDLAVFYAKLEHFQSKV